jgi:hypothetical protein
LLSGDKSPFAERKATLDFAQRRIAPRECLEVVGFTTEANVRRTLEVPMRRFAILFLMAGTGCGPSTAPQADKGRPALEKTDPSARQTRKRVVEPLQAGTPATSQKPDTGQKDSGSILPFEAVAPRERLKAIKIVQIKGKHQMFDGSRVTRDFVMTWQGVDRTKVEQTLQGRGRLGGLGRLGRLKLAERDSLTVLLIGEHGWAARGKNRQRLGGDVLGFYQNFHYGTVLSNLIALTAEGFKAVPAGDLTIRGKNCFAVVVKRAGKPDLKMFFDRDTKLLYKTEFKGRFVDQNLRPQRFETFVEFFFTDYRVVDGIYHWHVREQWRNGRQAAVLRLSEVRLLKEKDDSLFYFPAFDQEVKMALAAKE